MVKSIQELCDRMEKKELKRLKDGKAFSGGYVLLSSSIRNINEQSSDVFSEYIEGESDFCSGFLHGLLASHFITEEEFDLLNKERSSAYHAYFERKKLRQEEKSGTIQDEISGMEILFPERETTT